MCTRGMRHYACMCALSGTVCGCARCDTPRSRRCALCACHPRRHWCSHCCAFGPTCSLFHRSHFSHMFSLYSHGILGVVFTRSMLDLREGNPFGYQVRCAFHAGLRFMAAGIFVHHLRPVPTVFSSCLLHSHPLTGLWSVRLPGLFRGSFSLCLGSALMANILSSGSLICAVIVDVFSHSVA